MCFENIQQIYRKTPTKCDFNRVALQNFEITLRHKCSPVNLLHIFRTPFYKNTYGELLLQIRNLVAGYTNRDNIGYLRGITAKNTVISPNSLVWTFCRNAQFSHSFGRIAENYAETVPFHNMYTPRN